MGAGMASLGLCLLTSGLEGAADGGGSPRDASRSQPPYRQLDTIIATHESEEKSRATAVPHATELRPPARKNIGTFPSFSELLGASGGTLIRIVPAVCLPAALVLVLIAADAFLIEPRALETNFHTYYAPKLGSPTRIVVLADFQTDRITDYERHVFDEVVALKPDLVLFPGPFLQVYDHTRPTEAASFRALLQRLSPRLGMWAVQGNVDPPGSGDLFAGTNVRYLETTQTVQINDEITLTALSLSDSFDPRYSLPPAAAGFHIAMGHAPDFALGKTSGTDLLVAGHTHGGQVQLPFVGPLITLSRVPRNWGGGGLFALPSTGKLLVSRGVGMERGLAPRLRFLCRPEIVVLDLKPAM